MDDKIVSLIKDRDEEGIKLLEQQYGKMIFYIVRSIIADNGDVEECVSDIYHKIWDKIELFNPIKGKFCTWLTAISRNTAVTKLKQREEVKLELDEQMASNETAESIAERNEQRIIIKRAVATLSSFERQLFYRKYYYMQSTEQIAAETGISLRAAEGRLYRIRKKLRKVLEVYFDD